MPSKSVLNIYTDGACSGNPGPGGWGAYLEYGENGSEKITKEIFGYNYETTNNQMEIVAAIEALKILKKPCTVNLYTDSKYLQLGITKWIHTWRVNNWLKSNNKPVKNAQLWQKLQDEIARHVIIWHWVKGHSNNYGNIIADKLAVKGREIAKTGR
jgi:ribonuclease HI